jgi:RHS repeat-associated protein
VNRLTHSQASGGNPERYHYDGHGRRTATFRADGSVKVDYYTRDGVLRATADTGMGSTGGTAFYIHLGDQLVAQDAWAWRSPFGMTYFHVDHQGTPLARSDAWGMVFERTRRQSFGQPLAGPLRNGPGYTGHMEDPGTGLVYMQQRYYDPAIGRFLSVDPVGPLEDARNHFGRYHYALNNPYRFTDPDGREAKCTGSHIQSHTDCSGFAGNQGPQRTAADLRSSGDAVVDSEVAGIRRTHAGMLGTVREAAQTASAIGDGLETIYLTGISGGVGGGIAGAARGAVNVNKLNHVFGNSSHRLDDLVRASGGSQEAAFRAVQQAANQALREGRLTVGPNGVLPGGQAGAVLKVNGIDVQLVGGRVVGGEVQIATFSRRFLSD